MFLTTILLFVLFAFSFGNAQTLIHNFPFDGSYNDAVGSSYYFQNGSFFRTDRNGNPLKAIEVNSVNGGIAGGAMPDIPVGANHRTISIWVKFFHQQIASIDILFLVMVAMGKIKALILLKHLVL